MEDSINMNNVLDSQEEKPSTIDENNYVNYL